MDLASLIRSLLFNLSQGGMLDPSLSAPDIKKEGVGKVIESVKFLTNSIIVDYLIL